MKSDVAHPETSSLFFHSTFLRLGVFAFLVSTSSRRRRRRTRLTCPLDWRILVSPRQQNKEANKNENESAKKHLPIFNSFLKKKNKQIFVISPHAKASSNTRTTFISCLFFYLLERNLIAIKTAMDSTPAPTRSRPLQRTACLPVHAYMSMVNGVAILQIHF